jgi:hypothetical protein
MTDITYGSALLANAAKVTDKPATAPESKNLFVWIVEAMIEARRLQAETMFKNHLYGAY